MNNVYRYKGYGTEVEFDSSHKVLFGRIRGIHDLVTFESESPEGIEQAFQKAVDDYLFYCQDIGKDPEREYNGLLNVCIQRETHRKLAMRALENRMSLDQMVEDAIEHYLSEA